MTALRLSDKEAVILELLARDGEMYGLRLVSASGGQLKRGTVYVTLARMEAKGLVASREEARQPGASGLPRPLYRPTPVGLQVLAAARSIGALPAPAEGPANAGSRPTLAEGWS